MIDKPDLLNARILIVDDQEANVGLRHAKAPGLAAKLPQYGGSGRHA